MEAEGRKARAIRVVGYDADLQVATKFLVTQGGLLGMSSLQILIPTAFCQEMGDTVSPGVIQRYNLKQGPQGCKAH